MVRIPLRLLIIIIIPRRIIEELLKEELIITLPAFPGMLLSEIFSVMIFIILNLHAS